MKKMAIVVSIGMVFVLGMMLYVSKLNASQAPYGPQEEARFQALESGTGIVDGVLTVGKLSDYSATGFNVQRVAKFQIASTATNSATGTYTLPLTLPAGAIVEQFFVRIGTQFTATATSTLAIGCATTGDLLAATAITGIATSTITAGVQTGGAAAMSYITSTCTVKYTVATNPNGGILNGFVRYRLN